MIAVLLIPIGLMIAFSGFLSGEIDAIAEENGIDDFDEEAPSIYDGRVVDVGSNEPDELIGTEGDDALFSLGQTDVVRALGGDDLVDAGTNNDTVFAGDGDDIVGGNTGFDQIYGEAGNDTLLGNGGDDLLIGRAGNDVLIGGGGADSLNGGDGDDVLISGNITLGGEDSGSNLSATGVAAARDFSDFDLENIDFDALEDDGALNGVDTRFLTERAEPTQGGDLRGGSGDDVLILAGGDEAQGGPGADRFVLSEDMVDEMTVQITDYAPEEDVLALEYEGENAPDIDVRDRGDDALIFIGEDVIARIVGGAGLTADDITLVSVG